MSSLERFVEELKGYWTGKLPGSALEATWKELKGFCYHLLEEHPFCTESCGQCSHHAWGAYKDDKLVSHEDGETNCCVGEDGVMYELNDDSPCEYPLTAEEALDHEVCSRYDGYYEKEPFKRSDVEKYIKTRDEMLKILGFQPGEHFLEKIKLSAFVDRSRVDPDKVCHIAMIRGNITIPLNLYDIPKMYSLFKSKKTPKKVKEKILGIAGTIWGSKHTDKDTKKQLAELMSFHYTSKQYWTMEEYGEAQHILFDYILKKEEHDQFSKAVHSSFGVKGKKLVWYSSLHKFVEKGERRDVVQKLMKYIIGVSCAISES